MTEWQLIEAAPKDGTNVDLWVYCHDPKWRPDDHGIERGSRVTDARWSEGEWQQFHCEEGDWFRVETEHYAASHWMPVPTPPVCREDKLDDNVLD